MTERIGFIGLGIMGARHGCQHPQGRLPPDGVESHARARTEPLAAAGAAVADTPAALAMASDIIITCVSDTPDVEAVILGEDGVLHGVQPGSLVIDMSTISPAVTQQIAAALAERDVAMLDAPVSGGSEGAARGTLSIMVGGSAESLERAMPVLQTMGQRITHVGPSGAGQTVKLVNQVIVVGNCLAMAEGLMLAQAGGVDLREGAGSGQRRRGRQLDAQQPRPADTGARLGGPVLPSPCSRKTCAWCWKPPTTSARRCPAPR